MKVHPTITWQGVQAEADRYALGKFDFSPDNGVNTALNLQFLGAFLYAKDLYCEYIKSALIAYSEGFLFHSTEQSLNKDCKGDK
jgi:hypothetical protein